MKTKFNHVWLLTVCGVCILTSCNNPERAFQKAEQANTEQAYQQFLQLHPKSPLVATAEARLAKLAYQNAKLTNTVAALESFLTRFPPSEPSTNARTDLENMEFELAGRVNTEPAWSDFLKKYTNSTHIAAGREGLGKCVFARVSQENTAAAYEGFLTNHADCTLVSEAREKLASSLLAEALKANAAGAYEAVVKRFPDTRAATEAGRSLAKLDYDASVKENTIAAYEQFLTKHAASERASDAKTRLESQLDDRDWNQALVKNTKSACGVGYVQIITSSPNKITRAAAGAVSPQCKRPALCASFSSFGDTSRNTRVNRSQNMKATQQLKNPILTDRTRLLLAGAASILLALFTGCSRPTKYLAVQVESDPPGASVIASVGYDEISMGKTPTGPKVLAVRLKGGLLPINNPLGPDDKLTISKDGFESATLVIGEYKYSARDEALRNVRTIKVTLKPKASAGAAGSSPR